MNKQKYLILESAHVGNVRKYNKTPLGTIEFEAVLQEADVENRNKRIYPKSVLAEGMKDITITRGIATKNLMGEAGHPTEKDMAVQSQVNPMKSAFLIKKLWWEGNLLIGSLETANTALGRDMGGLIEQGMQVGFSLRAQGDVRPNPSSGGSIVKPGLRIVTWDWVLNPSHDRAYMRDISSEMNLPESFMMTESVNFNTMLESNEGLLTIEDLNDSGIIFEKFIDNGTGKLVHCSEIYFYDNEDKLLLETYSNAFGTIKLKNGSNIKTVKLEDYLIKDIRNNILTESINTPNKKYSSLMKRKK